MGTLLRRIREFLWCSINYIMTFIAWYRKYLKYCKNIKQHYTKFTIRQGNSLTRIFIEIKKKIDTTVNLIFLLHETNTNRTAKYLYFMETKRYLDIWHIFSSKRNRFKGNVSIGFSYKQISYWRAYVVSQFYIKVYRRTRCSVIRGAIKFRQLFKQQ